MTLLSIYLYILIYNLVKFLQYIYYTKNGQDFLDTRYDKIRLKTKKTKIKTHFNAAVVTRKFQTSLENFKYMNIIIIHLFYLKIVLNSRGFYVYKVSLSNFFSDHFFFDLWLYIVDWLYECCIERCRGLLLLRNCRPTTIGYYSGLLL